MVGPGACQRGDGANTAVRRRHRLTRVNDAARVGFGRALFGEVWVIWAQVPGAGYWAVPGEMLANDLHWPSEGLR